jgi:hypothetical protein
MPCLSTIRFTKSARIRQVRLRRPCTYLLALPMLLERKRNVMLRDDERYTTLAKPTPRGENPLIDEDLNPIDLSKDLHRGDCMSDQVEEIERAIGR